MGAVKKGCKNWTKSKQYLKLQREIRYLYYRLAVMRKQEHHILANQIVCESKIVKSEKISYKAFQKMYGKSIGKSAPSMFINILKKKLSLYGGTFIDIPTKTTKLSQTCICGQVKKKKLSTRHHKCDCGVNMQRDLFSAFLAIFVTKSGKLSIKKAKKNYPIYEPILNECLNKLRELKKNKPEAIISTFGI